MVGYHNTVSKYIAAGSSSSRDFRPEVDFVTSAARRLAEFSRLLLTHDELWSIYQPLFELLFGPEDVGENRESVKLAFLTMVDHLDPENPLVELAIGTDHITAPRRVFMDQLGRAVLCRVDTTIENREDNMGRGILDSGAYLNPHLELVCGKVLGTTTLASNLGVHVSKELAIWLNPNIFDGANWKAPFTSAHTGDEIAVEEGDEMDVLDEAPTITTLHEVAHTVMVVFGEWDMEKIIDEHLDPEDLPAEATAEDCGKAPHNFDRTRPMRAYGWYLCLQLAQGSTPWKTLTNAESYCEFALLVFLYKHGWDLSSGVAKRVDEETMNKLSEAWRRVQEKEVEEGVGEIDGQQEQDEESVGKHEKEAEENVADSDGQQQQD